MIKRRRPRGERGMVASEYAVGTLGGCGVACTLLYLAPDFDEFIRSILERGLTPLITGLL